MGNQPRYGALALGALTFGALALDLFFFFIDIKNSRIQGIVFNICVALA